MKKLTKALTSSMCAILAAASMSLSAFAAGSNDVLTTAKDACVPQRYISNLKNYLDSHPSYFKSDDYDYMIKQINDTAEKYLLPKAKSLFGNDVQLSSLTNDQRKKLYKSLTDNEYNGIIKALKDTCAKFNVKVSVTKRDTGIYDIKILDKDGNVVINTTTGADSNGPLTTGSGAFDTVECAAAVAILLAAAGIVALNKSNRKSEC